MTLGVIWLHGGRQGYGTPEVCLAIDSRASPGKFDGAPKTLLFSRTDIAGLLSGDLATARFISHVIDVGLRSSEAMRTRYVDVHDAFRHVPAFLESTGPALRDLVESGVASPVHIVLAGYSIKFGRFERTEVVLDQAGTLKIPSDPSEILVGAPVWIGGGLTPFEANKRVETLRSVAGDWPSPQAVGHVGMAPLQVLNKVCLADGVSTVGGSPQLVKVYRHGHVEEFGVVYRGKTYLAGVANARASAELKKRNRLVNLEWWDDAALWFSEPVTVDIERGPGAPENVS